MDASDPIVRSFSSERKTLSTNMPPEMKDLFKNPTNLQQKDYHSTAGSEGLIENILELSIFDIYIASSYESDPAMSE